jgi:hypothetical protein
MNETIFYTGILVVVTCGSCGTKHAIPKDLDDDGRENGTKWYCPKGCHITYVKTEISELKQQLKYSEQSNEHKQQSIINLHNQLTDQKHKTRSEKAAKTRLKNRVKHGVCPCCNRTFKQLSEHMKIKHPEYIQS